MIITYYCEKGKYLKFNLDDNVNHTSLITQKKERLLFRIAGRSLSCYYLMAVALGGMSTTQVSS